ncbi:LOW QUALITY PROTEIN: hypothetical protein RJ641_014040, partial [Dillenia turbinata]
MEGPRDRVVAERLLASVACSGSALIHVPGTSFYGNHTIQLDVQRGEPYHSVQLLTLNPDGYVYRSQKRKGNVVMNVGTLDTIPKDLEGPDMRSQSLVVEWAHQRLPLPHALQCHFSLTMDVSSPVRCIIDMETAFFVCCLVGIGIEEEQEVGI